MPKLSIVWIKDKRRKRWTTTAGKLKAVVEFDPSWRKGNPWNCNLCANGEAAMTACEAAMRALLTLPEFQEAQNG